MSNDFQYDQNLVERGYLCLTHLHVFIIIIIIFFFFLFIYFFFFFFFLLLLLLFLSRSYVVFPDIAVSCRYIQVLLKSTNRLMLVLSSVL